MKKYINEVHRMQQLAGVVKEADLAGMLGVDVGDLTNEKVEGLLTAVMNHFYDNAEELSNMDARGIADDIKAALTKLKDRVSN